VLERGPLKLDAKRFTASWKNQSVALTLTEFWMVHTLAKFPGHVRTARLLCATPSGGGRRHDHLAREAHPQKFAAVDPSVSSRSIRCMGWATGGRRERFTPLPWIRRGGAKRRGGSTPATPPRRLRGTPPQERRGQPNHEARHLFSVAEPFAPSSPWWRWCCFALPWAGYEYVREMERFPARGPGAGAARHRARRRHRSARSPEPYARPAPRDTDVRREAEEELRRLAAERGEPPEEGAEPTLIIDREESAGRSEPEEIAQILKGVERTTSRIWVVTRELRVLALAGSLRREGARRRDCHAARARAPDPAPERGLRRRHRRRRGSPPAARSPAPCRAGRWFRLRNTPDGRAVVISAGAPDLERRRSRGRGRRSRRAPIRSSRCASQATGAPARSDARRVRGGRRAC